MLDIPISASHFTSLLFPRGEHMTLRGVVTVASLKAMHLLESYRENQVSKILKCDNELVKYASGVPDDKLMTHHKIVKMIPK